MLKQRWSKCFPKRAFDKFLVWGLCRITASRSIDSADFQRKRCGHWSKDMPAIMTSWQKRFSHYLPDRAKKELYLVRGIHRSLVDPLTKDHSALRSFLCVILNKLVNKQRSWRLFETEPCRLMWRHCNTDSSATTYISQEFYENCEYTVHRVNQRFKHSPVKINCWAIMTSRVSFRSIIDLWRKCVRKRLIQSWQIRKCTSKSNVYFGNFILYFHAFRRCGSHIED